MVAVLQSESFLSFPPNCSSASGPTQTGQTRTSSTSSTRSAVNSTCCSLHEVKRLIGPTNLKKLKFDTPPNVRDQDGRLCQNPSGALDTWVSFFQTMEGGERLDSPQQRKEWIDNLRKFSSTSLDLQLQDLPSLTGLEVAYRRVQRQRRPSFSRPSSTAIRVCYLKEGRLHPSVYAEGAKDRCDLFRSILISSHIGKSIHRCLRSYSEKFLQKQQLGGTRKIPVTLGVHQARAYLRSRKRQGANIGMVFLDLCEAFYRIVRELTIGGAVCDEALQR